VKDRSQLHQNARKIIQGPGVGPAPVPRAHVVKTPPSASYVRPVTLASHGMMSPLKLFSQLHLSLLETMPPLHRFPARDRRLSRDTTNDPASEHPRSQPLLELSKNCLFRVKLLRGEFNRTAATLAAVVQHWQNDPKAMLDHGSADQSIHPDRRIRPEARLVHASAPRWPLASGEVTAYAESRMKGTGFLR
jgi:hypothetical protein